MPKVHEEERDDEGLDGGNGESDGGIETSEIDEGDPVRDEGTQQQRGPDGKVRFQRRGL
jgi:hypothetical protein